MEGEEKPAADAEDSPTYYCTHCRVYVTSASELNSHLEAKHQPFVENIFKLFPQVRKRFAVHLEKVFNEFIIEPKTDTSPITAKVVAGVKRKSDAATKSAAPEPKKKPVVRKALPVLRLPFQLFKGEERYREQQFREKELLDKLSPSQLRQENEEVIYLNKISKTLQYLRYFGSALSFQLYRIRNKYFRIQGKVSDSTGPGFTTLAF